MSKHVEIKLDPRGCGTVEIDGIDLANYLNGFSLISRVGDGTQIILSLAPAVSLEVALATANLGIDGECPKCQNRILLRVKS